MLKNREIRYHMYASDPGLDSGLFKHNLHVMTSPMYASMEVSSQHDQSC